MGTAATGGRCVAPRTYGSGNGDAAALKQGRFSPCRGKSAAARVEGRPQGPRPMPPRDGRRHARGGGAAGEEGSAGRRGESQSRGTAFGVGSQRLCVTSESAVRLHRLRSALETGPSER